MLKVTVIGAGSTYTPELVKGFIERMHELPLTELWLMDIDAERLKIVGSFAQRVVAAQGSPFRVVLTDNRSQAITGADYVLTQFRIGMMQARREDEYLGRRHGLIGQETTGVGGMAKALRTIPVMLDIASDIRRLAPEALLINFTNPSGLVTEALNIYAPELRFVGVCNSALTTKMRILEELSRRHGQTYRPEQAEILTLGLNHLTWCYGFRLDGKDVWPEVFSAYLQELEADPDADFDPKFIANPGMMPNYYLSYYYNNEHKLQEQQAWPPSRAEEVMQVEEELLAVYRDPTRIEIPESLMKRGGAYYSTVAAQLIISHYNNLGETHVVNVNHHGAVRGWEQEWVLEMPCRVMRNGIYPIPAEPLPLYNYRLLDQIKHYELSTIEAAVHGDYQAALRALMTHPLGPGEDKAGEVLNDMLATNRAYLPNFKQ